MDDVKTTQNTAAQLPEPTEFTLEEVATRWSERYGKTVTPRHIVDWQKQGLVKLFDARMSIYGIDAWLETPKLSVFPPLENEWWIKREERDRFERTYSKGGDVDTVPAAPDAAPENRPWAHLVNSPNPKTGNLYKQEAKRIRESLTAEEKETWAREAVVRNEGNKAKAGRELGITANGVKYIMETKP